MREVQRQSGPAHTEDSRWFIEEAAIVEHDSSCAATACGNKPRHSWSANAGARSQGLSVSWWDSKSTTDQREHNFFIYSTAPRRSWTRQSTRQDIRPIARDRCLTMTGVRFSASRRRCRWWCTPFFLWGHMMSSAGVILQLRSIFPFGRMFRAAVLYDRCNTEAAAVPQLLCGPLRHIARRRLPRI